MGCWSSFATEGDGAAPTLAKPARLLPHASTVSTRHTWRTKFAHPSTRSPAAEQRTGAVARSLSAQLGRTCGTNFFPTQWGLLQLGARQTGFSAKDPHHAVANTEARQHAPFYSHQTMQSGNDTDSSLSKFAVANGVARATKRSMHAPLLPY